MAGQVAACCPGPNTEAQRPGDLVRFPSLPFLPLPSPSILPSSPLSVVQGSPALSSLLSMLSVSPVLGHCLTLVTLEIILEGL